MTKPFHDSGELRRVGEIKTPWSCFMIASTIQKVNEKRKEIQAFLMGLNESCKIFHSASIIDSQIAQEYGLQLEDAKEWRSNVRISARSEIDEHSLISAIQALREIGTFDPSLYIDLSDLIDARIGKVTKNIKSMRLYRQMDFVAMTFNHLRAINKSTGRLSYRDLLPFDQNHYHGVEALDLCVSRLKLQQGAVIINFGSGLGGPARYLAGRHGIFVVAIEIQEDLHDTAVELTNRCEDQVRGLVRHIAGNFVQLELSQSQLQYGTFDAIVSWLTVLHFSKEERLTLFSRAFSLLKHGGKMYLEDFYQRRELKPTEKNLLMDEVYCSYLPDWNEYRTQLESVGFQLIQVEDLSDQWTQFTKDRWLNWTTERERHNKIHGVKAANRVENFYVKIASLFERDGVGGIRIVATKIDSQQKKKSRL